MKPSELERCEENGVTDITEAKIGSDGIVLGLAASNEPIDLTLEQIFLAVAAQVPVDGELVDNPTPTGATSTLLCRIAPSLSMARPALPVPVMRSKSW